MSKLIYLCCRNGAPLGFGAQDIERVLSRLTPDNLTPRPPRIIEGAGTLIGIFNPVDSLPIRGESVCLGALFDRRADWWRPGAEVPDGSYALFRGDGETLELVSDIVGSRTIWYAQTDELFLASTSQRAIVCFLGSYEPNEAVYPWMLSSGTLGPGLSWDRRIRCLGPDARLRLDRRSWKIAIEQRPVVFAPEELSQAEHERRLGEAMEATFAGLDLDLKRWVLLLSGGYDSRAILVMLKERAGLKAVTWGLKSALEDRQSDAWVARELARHFGLAHEYHETDLSDEPVERLFQRYLVAGEGRVDHISGYMDGFEIWKQLCESGVDGVIRGDQAFGRDGDASDTAIYLDVGFTRLSDFANLRGAGIADLFTQSAPAELLRQQGETRQQWHDRLYQGYRHPAVVAALNDLKCSYVEITNPLLSREIVERIRRVPDRLRAHKGLHRNFVKRAFPSIPFARRAAIEAPADILRHRQVIGHITEYIRVNNAQTLCGTRVLSYIHRNLAGSVSASVPSVSLIMRAKALLKKVVPARAISFAKRLMGKQGKSAVLNADTHRLAFRVYIISRMNTLLIHDANGLKQT